MGQMGVAAFFLVSGFIIPATLEKNNNLKLFFLNRILRIYPLYIAIFIINFCFFFFFEKRTIYIFIDNLLINIVGLLFFLQTYLQHRFAVIDTVPGSWTLLLEACWYFLFAVLYYFKVNKDHKSIFYSSNLILLCLSILTLIIEKRLPIGIVGLLFSCVLGLTAFRYYKNEISFQRYIYYTASSLINLLIAFIVNFYIFENTRFTFISVFISWSMGFLIFYISFSYIHQVKESIIIKSIFIKLGLISYSLYLIHPTVIKISNLMELSNINAILFTIIISILLAFTIYYLIELPAINLGKKLAGLLFKKHLQSKQVKQLS